MENLTFGYEWEFALLRENLLLPHADDLKAFAYEISKRLSWAPVGFDHIRRGAAFVMELRSGILRSYSEFEEKTEELWEKVNELAKEKSFRCALLGSYPILGGPLGFHLHIGTFHTPTFPSRLSDYLFPYIPVLAALMVNSPVWDSNKYGNYKSWRLISHAGWCSIPYIFSPKGMRQWIWGTDVCNKAMLKSTLEIRVADSPTFLRVIYEYVPLVVGLVISFLKEKGEARVDELTYKHYIVNRWRASKYGLQAIFYWDKKEMEISEIIFRTFEAARQGMKEIGFNKSLSLFEEMARKRITQADFLEYIFQASHDPFTFTFEVTKISGKDDKFVNFLRRSKRKDALTPIPIRDEILSIIQDETPLYHIYERIRIPYPVLDQILSDLMRSDKIERVEREGWGPIYRRKES